MTQLGHKYSSITSALFPSYSNFISLFSLFYFYYFFYHKCSSFFSIKPNPYSRLETITRLFLGHLEHNMGFITSLLIYIPIRYTIFIFFIKFFSLFYFIRFLLFVRKPQVFFFFLFSVFKQKKKTVPKVDFPFLFLNFLGNQTKS